jgi:hypothetical protein
MLAPRFQTKRNRFGANASCISALSASRHSSGFSYWDHGKPLIIEIRFRLDDPELAAAWSEAGSCN